eukprot:TRINITY_DN10750_c0_g1_i1.p1 TRINITY_DN10750_c0_g1~~TRINITY_DN10750_c0_g1_i1.p1  ORF type:complete len:331 (+),score=68.35 TRINITY_DN10750_c0_g1_i1:94-993(+)
MVAALLLPVAQAFGEAQRYLLVSSPATHRIGYLKMQRDGAPPVNESLRILVDSGLSVPQGIAVDDYRKRLYVADPDLNKLVGYDIRHSGDAIVLGAQFTIATDVEPRWVAVDGVGNVFFTDESKNRILKLSAGAAETRAPATPEVLFDGSKNGSAVSSPGGIASDNIFLYWSNKAYGTQVGSLVRGVEGGGATVMANNAMKSYGVCMGTRHLFFTNEETHLYALSRSGSGGVQTVSSGFLQPRGCAFDGESTIYVADKMHNAVYQFSANSRDFSKPRKLTKAADFPGAFGVASYAKVTA